MAYVNRLCFSGDEQNTGLTLRFSDSALERTFSERTFVEAYPLVVASCAGQAVCAALIAVGRLALLAAHGSGCAAAHTLGRRTRAAFGGLRVVPLQLGLRSLYVFSGGLAAQELAALAEVHDDVERAGLDE